MAELEAGLELSREAALQTNAQAANLKAQKQADAGGSEDIAQAANALLATQESELEAQLVEAERRAVASSAGQVAAASPEGVGAHHKDHVDRSSKAEQRSLRSKLKDIGSQLARPKERSVELQQAASRAAERLQTQALKERKLEKQLAEASGGNTSA